MATKCTGIIVYYNAKCFYWINVKCIKNLCVNGVYFYEKVIKMDSWDIIYEQILFVLNCCN